MQKIDRKVIGSVICPKHSNHRANHFDSRNLEATGRSDMGSDLPKTLEDTGQITRRRQRAKNWTDSQKSDWVSDLPNHLKKLVKSPGKSL